MTHSTYRAWIEGRIRLAHMLESGSCGGTYADGAIILCTCISMMSRLMWTGQKNSDRKRFIELVTKFPKQEFDPTMVSVPLLSQKEEYWRQRLGIVYDLPVLYTSDVDKSEDAIMGICHKHQPSADRKRWIRKIRECSYANILYRDVRCGFIHEYSAIADAAGDDPLRNYASRGGSKITYVNCMNSREARLIYFPLEWLGGVARNIAVGLDDQGDRMNKRAGERLALAVPETWWIDGG